MNIIDLDFKAVSSIASQPAIRFTNTYIDQAGRYTMTGISTTGKPCYMQFAEQLEFGNTSQNLAVKYCESGKYIQDSRLPQIATGNKWMYLNNSGPEPGGRDTAAEKQEIANAQNFIDLAHLLFMQVNLGFLKDEIKSPGAKGHVGLETNPIVQKALPRLGTASVNGAPTAHYGGYLTAAAGFSDPFKGYQVDYWVDTNWFPRRFMMREVQATGGSITLVYNLSPLAIAPSISVPPNQDVTAPGE